MIKNGKDYLLTANPGTLPNVQGAMLNWFQTLIFTRLTKGVANFDLTETPKNYSFQGVKQPLSAQELQLKPEGQRNWKYFWIHALPDLVLEPDDVIKFTDGVAYRVIGKWDYTEYGYISYEIVQDFTK